MLDWSRVQIVTPANAPVLTTSEAKAQIRVHHNDEDALIDQYVRSATRLLEVQTGVAMMPQTWRYTLDCFDGDILLPGYPVQSVTSVNYFDTAKTEQTLAPDNYIFTNGVEPAAIEAAVSWPSTQARRGAVWVDYVVGSTPPADLLDAVRLLVAARFQYRDALGSEQELPLGVADAIQMNRRGVVAT